jgi:hypothetical protein
VIKSFLAGTVTGAAVMWIWGGQIRQFIDDRTRDVRLSASSSLQGVAGSLQAVATTVEQGLSGGGRSGGGSSSADRQPGQRFEQIDSSVRGPYQPS